MKGKILVLVTVLAVGVGVAASASATVIPYESEVTVANALEANGLTWSKPRRHHLDIDSAFCIGLRRYGVMRWSGVDRFTRLKCYLDGADGHSYMVQVKVIKLGWFRFFDFHGTF